MIRLQAIRVEGGPRVPGGGSSPDGGRFEVGGMAPKMDAIWHDPASGWVYILMAGKVRMVRVERIREADPIPAEAARIVAMSLEPTKK
jgi:hypothetical protein